MVVNTRGVFSLEKIREKELLDILNSYPIDVRILGEDYIDNEFTGKDIKGIEIYYNSRKHSFSSTSLRERIAKNN